jgi:hypothetical protein
VFKEKLANCFLVSEISGNLEIYGTNIYCSLYGSTVVFVKYTFEN